MSHLPIHPRLRHPLTGEPLRAVGFSRRGPIWPIIGAAEGGAGSGEGGSGEGGSSGSGEAGDGGKGGTSDSGESGEGSGELGDAGKRAIAEERESRKAAEKRAKAAEAELEKFRTANQSEHEKAVNAARKEGETASDERWRTRTVSAEVRAAAATLKFHDPRDAVVQLREKLGDIKVDDDGEPDGDAITKLLKDLAETKPYLVAEDGPKPPPNGFGGGPRRTENKPESTPGVGRLRDAYASSSNK